MKAIYEREAYGNVSVFINGRIKLLNCSKGKMSMCAKSLQLCSTFCNPTDCSPPGSSVHGILQARTLEWVAMPSFRGSSQPRDQTCSFCSSYIVGKFFYHWATRRSPKGKYYIPKIFRNHCYLYCHYFSKLPAPDSLGRTCLYSRRPCKHLKNCTRWKQLA